MTAEVVDMHREVSLRLLKSTTAYAVRTPKGQKDPGHLAWDPKTNSPEESRKTIHALERTDDNLGIHLHGTVIDVDIDTDNPYLMEALDYFLPPTTHVWGRKSRPRTHRLYQTTEGMGTFTPDQFPFLRVLQKFDEIKMEIRGGDARSGEYSLLPGSMHPSGEFYEWEDVGAAKATLAASDLFRIVNGVRFACVVALIAPFWTEGQRNDMCLALSGFLHRAAAHVADMGAMSYLFFEKKDAEKLMRGLMHVAGDDEQDEAMRMRTFEQTWQKADDGTPVKGATSLAKMTGRDDLLGLLYTLLADSPDLMEFDEFLDRYAVRNGTSNVIDREKAGSAKAAYLMTVADFRNSNMHRCITSGTGERRQMANMLLASPRATRVDGLVFNPEAGDIVHQDGGDYVNLWRGFRVPMADSPVAKEQVKVFLDYMNLIVANGDKGTYEWVLAWFADIFKNPASKPGTALVLVGKPGAGKSVMGSIARKIIGADHSFQTNSAEALVGKFNADSANKLFIQCDEALNSRRRSDALRLKSMITDPTIRIEPKGVNAYEIEDYARFFFTSNEITEAVAIVDGKDDRRYSVVKVNNDYADKSRLDPATKREFWNKLYGWIDDEDNLANLHRYLHDLEYDRAMLRTPLDTEARRRMTQHSQRGFDDWLMQLVSYEHPLENLRQTDQRSEESYVVEKGIMKPTLESWPDFVAYRRLEDSYEHYRRRKGMSATTPTYNAQQIKQEFVSKGVLDEDAQIKRVNHQQEVWVNGDVRVEHRKIRVTQMPTKEALQGYLWDQYGFVVGDAEDVEGEEPTKSSGVEF